MYIGSMKGCVEVHREVQGLHIGYRGSTDSLWRGLKGPQNNTERSVEGCTAAKR